MDMPYETIEVFEAENVHHMGALNPQPSDPYNILYHLNYQD